MDLATLLSDRLREVLTEGKWVTGSNFTAQISDLHWHHAIKKIADLNTIADLTFHVSYYIAGMSNVLEGGSLDIRDKYSFDYPPVQSHEDWQLLIKKFCDDAEKYINLVAQLSDAQLANTFIDEKYGTFHRNIDAIIEHSYYHLGQVILIKKMVGANHESY